MSKSTSIDKTFPDSTRNAREPAQAGSLRKFTELGGRVLLAALFLMSGLVKIPGYAATAGYMTAVGVPSQLLPAAIAIEILGALAIIAGWKTRVTALLLAGYSLVAALLFHSNFGDQIQLAMFMKNVSIAGGFLLLIAHGAGPLSLDNRTPVSKSAEVGVG